MNKGNLGSAIGNCQMRQSAIGVLDDRIARLRREADELEALKRALPELGAEADYALWRVLCDAHR